MFREVLRKVCVEDLRHEVVGEAADGERAVQVVGDTRPDLVLLDLHLPSLDGFGVVEAIRKTTPQVKVLILSSHCDGYTVFRSERAHVNGFVDKNTNSVAMLKTAIIAVAQGKVWFSEVFLKAKAARHRDPTSFDRLLTRRERAILTLVGLPLTDAQISAKLDISEETVEKHLSNILRKFGFQRTMQLIRYAREQGFTLTARQGGDGALLP